MILRRVERDALDLMESPSSDPSETRFLGSVRKVVGWAWSVHGRTLSRVMGVDDLYQAVLLELMQRSGVDKLSAAFSKQSAMRVIRDATRVKRFPPKGQKSLDVMKDMEMDIEDGSDRWTIVEVMKCLESHRFSTSEVSKVTMSLEILGEEGRREVSQVERKLEEEIKRRKRRGAEEKDRRLAEAKGMELLSNSREIR